MTIDFTLLQLAVFGFFTGMGTTLGTELGKTIFSWVKERVNGKKEDKKT